jgi:hypothetical protein
LTQKLALAFALAMGALPLSACSSDGVGGSVKSAAGSVAHGVGSVPSLVNVDLRNVLNNLALDLHLDRANVPINAQIPITLAANICGVSINVLSVSTGGQANCSAKTSSPELAQVVQQQIAAGGSVGGGAQGGSTATNPGTSATGSGTAGAGGAPQTGGTSGGAAGTSGTSSGATTGSPANAPSPSATFSPAQ